MLVIVGLGNPGTQYKNTYHNVGFMALDAFAKEQDLVFSSKKYKSLMAKGNIGGEKYILLKPQTYMNLSGLAVSEVIRKLKLPLGNVLVICDDVDLPLATIRFRKEGSAGTHNGMRSIVENLSSNNFARIKIGIGRDERMPLDKFVLSKISKTNKELIDDKMSQIIALIEKFIIHKGDIEGETITK